MMHEDSTVSLPDAPTLVKWLMIEFQQPQVSHGCLAPPFPALPVEICRHILELAAEMDSQMALTLILVSKAVCNWCLNLLILYTCNFV